MNSTPRKLAGEAVGSGTSSDAESRRRVRELAKGVTATDQSPILGRTLIKGRRLGDNTKPVGKWSQKMREIRLPSPFFHSQSMCDSVVTGQQKSVSIPGL